MNCTGKEFGGRFISLALITCATVSRFEQAVDSKPPQAAIMHGRGSAGEAYAWYGIKRLHARTGRGEGGGKLTMNLHLELGHPDH